QSSVIPQDVKEDNLDIEVTHMGNDPLLGVPITEVTSAQSSSMNIVVYQMDVKTVFLNGNLREKVYVSQPDRNENDLLLMSMMGKISFFLGLQISQSPRGIFINESKYALESLNKYGFESCDPVDTPMVGKSKLDEDKEGKAVDPSHYRGMISTLLYLTASRPDLQFAICMVYGIRRILLLLQKHLQMRIMLVAKILAAVHLDYGYYNQTQQLAMDEALVPTAKRLKIGRSNFRLLSNIMSKESTLQLVYDVLRRCPFFKAFLVTVDDPSIPRRNKVNWHYVRDDFMFFMIKLVSKHQNMQQFDALLPIELTDDEMRNSKAYKEYYAIATGEAAPKPKASFRRTRSSSDTSITPPTAVANPRLIASAKGKQTAKASKAKVYLPSLSRSGADKGTSSKPGVPDVPTDESEEELSWNSTDDEGDENKEQDDDGDEEDEGDDSEEGNGDDDDDDEVDNGEEGDDDDADQEVVRDDDKDDNEEGGDDEHESDEETREEESFDPILQTPEDSEDDGDGKEDLGLNIGKEERHDEEEEEDELYRDVNINQGRGLAASLEVKDSHVTLTLVKPDVLSDIIQHLPSFGSLFRFDDRLRSLKENFSEFSQINRFAGVVSSIPEIVNHYMDQWMNAAVRVAIQIQSDRLRDETQRENDEFLRTVDENINKIIKKQVKEQVKAQVSKILPRIEQAMNEQLEPKVLTRSSHSSRTSYAVAADLSEMEQKRYLLRK
nr:uncharacterized mitochondrial protein AtMg00810-like [Tanacetum cinerariifolium]